MTHLKSFVTLSLSLVVFMISDFTFSQNSQYPMVFSTDHEDEIHDLISQMTIKEKTQQLGACYYGLSKHSNANLRLGIPNLFSGECLHCVKANGATVFPQAIAMASTWDPEVIEKMGHVVAREARAFGITHCFSPMLSVARDVRWGRIEETYGEDPFLVGEMGTAYIKGLQGTGSERFDQHHVLACAKHYVADGEPLAGDNGAAMDISDYNLHNIHLYPFRMAFREAKAASIMAAHHLLNGIPCHANQYILNDILRDQYQWNGLVISDNKDLPRMVDLFKYAKDFQNVASLSLEAGVHQEVDARAEYVGRVYGESLIAGVENGMIPERLLDEAVAANLRAKFELGLFETAVPSKKAFTLSETGPPVQIAPPEVNREVINQEPHQELALEVAHKAIVLLKNDGNTLPLDINKLNRIAVIGPNADAHRLGGYSGDPEYFITILDGIRAFVGSGIEVRYAEGAGIDTTLPSEEDQGKRDIEVTRYADDTHIDVTTPEQKKIQQAVALARGSDVVILALGGSEATCRENQDTDFLGLRGYQQALAKEVYATGTPCVVALIGGRPLAIPWLAKNIPAIIQGWYLGQETGTALADILFGKVNPGGKLPVSMPRNVGQVPLFYNKLETGRSRNIYRSSHEPLFPFGYGLSYTTFEINNLQLEKETIATDENTVLSVDITNTGQMTGEEVVQLYIRALYTGRVRPDKELRGFQRVHLEPGETKTLKFDIGETQLEYWNEKWVVESGEYHLSAATNSSDEQLKKHQVKLIVIE